MQLNKSKRVRSACHLRNSPQLKPFQNQNDSAIKRDSFEKDSNKIFLKQSQSPQDERIKQKQNLFRSGIKSLSQTFSMKRFKPNLGFTEYNHETWRVVNTAKSLNRLESMKKIDNKDPIKINLQQKLQRIKSKHIENEHKTLDQSLSLKKNEKSKKHLQYQCKDNSVQNKINQILEKWQKGKLYSSEVYRRKIQIISQESPIKKITEKQFDLNIKTL